MGTRISPTGASRFAGLFDVLALERWQIRWSYDGSHLHGAGEGGVREFRGLQQTASTVGASTTTKVGPIMYSMYSYNRAIKHYGIKYLKQTSKLSW